MALSRAVVASRIYGIPELVEDGATGILVEPGDADALARAISSLAGDPALASRLGAAGRARFETDFRVERCAAETVSIYREILNRR
jgi:glycosyltransferase involved in cell wall biosynthesis